MSEMKYSDEILAKSQSRGLTKSERHELREAYNHEQAELSKNTNTLGQSVKDYKGDAGKVLPRHLIAHKCPSFSECAIDFKCKSYNSSYLACVNCELHEVDGICHKGHIHTEKACNMMVKRARIDLDGD